MYLRIQLKSQHNNLQIRKVSLKEANCLKHSDTYSYRISMRTLKDIYLFCKHLWKTNHVADTFLGTEHTTVDNKGNGPVQLEIYILFLMHYEIFKILSREYMIMFTILTVYLGNCVRIDQEGAGRQVRRL